MKHIYLMDTDTDYVENAAAWAGLHIRDKVRLTILTDPDAAYETLKRLLQVDCVLLTPSMLIAMEPDIHLTSHAFIILLEDGEAIPDVLEPGGQLRRLSKYQSLRSLFETVLESALPQKQTGASSQRAKTTISISCLHAGYSTDAMPVAAAMALLLASWRYRVFFFDLEFGTVGSSFPVPSGDCDVCDLLLHAKNRGHRDPSRLQACMAQDAVTGVYAFRDGAGIYDHEDLDAQTLHWVLESLIASDSFDYVVINTGSFATRLVTDFILRTDCSFVVSDSATEQRTMRCQKLLHTLQKTGDQANLPHVLSVRHEDTDNRSSHENASCSCVYPLSHPSIWMQNTVFLEQIAGILLPHIKGGV